MAKNDFQYGGWNYYTLQCGTIMTLISPGDCTLQCGMWFWNHDSEFTKWQHPAMWQVALGWHAMEFAQTSAMLEFYIWFLFWPSPQSTCYPAPVCEILSKSDHPRQKKMSRFFAFWRQTDRQACRQTSKQTNNQMDSIDALSRTLCRQRRLNDV